MSFLIGNISNNLAYDALYYKIFVSDKIQKYSAGIMPLSVKFYFIEYVIYRLFLYFIFFKKYIIP